MSEGFDYSWGRPGAAAVKAAGGSFIMRYLYPDGQGGKGLDASEVSDARAHGLLIGVVYESSANRALAGYAAGASDASVSANQLAALGMQGTAVYFGVDFAANGSQMDTINAYLNGAASVLGKNKTGVYGSYSVIEATVGNSCDYGWQTYAWSAGQVSSKAHVYQYQNGQTLNGSGVDKCRNLRDDFGAFGGTATASLGGVGGAQLAVNQTSLTWLQVQILLNAFGYGLVEDDVNGPNTTAALGDFQAKHGLVKDFVLGPLTLAKLQVPPAAPAPAAVPAATVRLLVVDGNLGALTTKAEQRALGVSDDGIRGHNTILAEQKRTGATPDGVDGPNTREHLQLRLQALGFYKGAIDTIIGPQSIMALQSALNAGRF